MDKKTAHHAICSALFSRFNTAKWAAHQAHEAATSKESIAENKYDTFGLEASYLAHGQSQRVLECEKDWRLFDKKTLALFAEEESIALWCLVFLTALDAPSENEKAFFLSPCAGGLTLDVEGKTLYLITSSSPVGQALMGKKVGDDVQLRQNGRQITYEITGVA
ncbi:GreA/GreB family elongation factor [Marinomonas sp. IMCC 4694]|uniref:GreA/GreB family elongation factor n=1 Tax=Marinomonas sp. IMCC 4694 TaxID=2605432 RepID=UPI0011E82A61|nr:GreA/GreB family elongation factor [Marinomonas sp. IMCC 4694]TYL47800.1 GreA/GreB family elongation factor [Marinomonas sp. IMCC 4694]